MKPKFLIVFLATCLLVTMVNARFAEILGQATSIANGIGGQAGQGEYDRGKGCTVRWSFKGQLIGIKWKFIGTCVDSCTGIAKTAIMKSKGGAIEHCLTDLNQELARRHEL